MDYNLNSIPPLIAINSNGNSTNLSAAETAAENIQAKEVYDNNCLTVSNCNQDEDSNLDGALSGINTLMPLPGNGTNNSGDTPQEVLMIVTDGVNDYSGSGRVIDPIDNNGALCSAIKARGIRIAFLYLTYNPMRSNSFYNSNVWPFQNPTDQVATAAQNCASPGLYFEVNTDGDVTAAMTTLFQEAVATARLIQ
jgi:hypothetical protein